jgi:S1-C subfamily serine protease
LKAGDKLTLSVLHGDATRSVDVTLADQNGKVYLGIHPAIVISGLGERLFGRGMGSIGKQAAFKGALVTAVSANGPAAQAGLQAGDQILSVNGKTVDANNDLATLVQALKPGDTATLSVQKKGAAGPADVKVTLGDDPNKAGTAYLGLSYRLAGAALPNGPTLRNFGQAPFNKVPRANQSGVLVSSVMAGSPAEKAGVKSNDLITAVNGKAITTPDELSSLVKAAKVGDKMTLTITRSGEQNPLAIDVTLLANPDNSGAPYLGVTLMALRQQPQLPKATPTPNASGANF